MARPVFNPEAHMSDEAEPSAKQMTEVCNVTLLNSQKTGFIYSHAAGSMMVQHFQYR